MKRERQNKGIDTVIPYVRLSTLWLVFNLLPFILLRRQFHQLLWYDIGTEVNLKIVFVPLLAVLVAESLLIINLCALFKVLVTKLGHQWVIRLSVFILGVVILASYVTLLCASWIYFDLRGAFLTLEDLSLWQAFYEPAILRSWVVKGDAQAALLLAAAALLFSGLFFSAAPGFNARHSALTLGFALALVTAAGLLVLRYPPLRSPSGKGFFLLSQLSGPQLAFSLKLLESRRSPVCKTKAFTPIPAYGLDMYKKKIPLEWQPSRNVIVFLIESLRSDVLAINGGDPAIIPWINKLVDSGVSFPHAYTNSPETAYSQATIVTSLHPLKSQTRPLNYDLTYPFLRIYDLLADLGYATAYLTVEIKATKRLTYSKKVGLYSDPVHESAEKLDDLVTDQTFLISEDLMRFDLLNLERLKRFLANSIKQEKQFFAMIYLGSSHFPYYFPPEPQPIFQPFDMPPDLSFLAYPIQHTSILRNRYWNSLRFLDHQIGLIIQTLDSLGQSEQTIFLVTGDHGQLFNEGQGVTHGLSLNSLLIHVPLVISGPIKGKEHVQVQRTVGHIDIAPTILDLLGLPPHDNFQGQSVLTSKDTLTHVSPRPFFLTLQTTTFQDGIIVHPWIFILDQRTYQEFLFNIERDPLFKDNLRSRERALADKLKDTLLLFRHQQLSYYAQPGAWRTLFFPPTIPTALE